MSFEEDMQLAARAAERAVNATMRSYAQGGVVDEPEITGVLTGQLGARLEGQIGGLQWNSRIVRNGKGVAAEEKRTGADLLIHVSLDTPTERYSKGVLIQAKRCEPNEVLSSSELRRLQGQCDTMLNRTPAAYVFTYARGSMRCGAANRFTAAPDGELYRRCSWTPYRFFLELFRCPIGDRQIYSNDPEDLPVPRIIQLSARSDEPLDLYVIKDLQLD
jgi:hypothetical protein